EHRHGDDRVEACSRQGRAGGVHQLDQEVAFTARAPAEAPSRHQPRSSFAMSWATERAFSTSSALKLIAETAGCPPPPYRSAIPARLCRRKSCRQGFDPSETLLRFVPRVTVTV